MKCEKDNDVLLMPPDLINHLVELAKEEYFIMPSELTREERRKWAKTNQSKKEKNNE